jgi:hypothetical protein
MKWIATCLTLNLLLFSQIASSRDTQHYFSIQDALQSEAFKQKLDPKIKLFFANKKVRVKKRLGNFTSNKKTNSFNKSDLQACQWALLSALLSMQNRAVKEGGNAVINISSYYKKQKYTSTTKFECHAGAMITGVALNADVAEI